MVYVCRTRVKGKAAGTRSSVLTSCSRRARPRPRPWRCPVRLGGVLQNLDLAISGTEVVRSTCLEMQAVPRISRAEARRGQMSRRWSFFAAEDRKCECD